jgi:ParB family chromosome partitioning protein
MSKRLSLGKNLQALLGPTHLPTETSGQSNTLLEVPIEHLTPGKYQPRTNFNIESLQELSQSIKQQGVLQPILVREIRDNVYEILAGERRWRAAKLAGLEAVPVIKNFVDNKTAMAIGLVENLQRDDLNTHEQAVAIQRLINEFELTHQQIADVLGKSRAAISNLLRLLQLPEPVQQMLALGKIDMGHARALLSLPTLQQQELAQLVFNKQLSVRQTEQIVKNLLNPKENQAIKQDLAFNNELETLRQRFKTNVMIKHNSKGNGNIVISFKNISALHDLLAKLCMDN